MFGFLFGETQEKIIPPQEEETVMSLDEDSSEDEPLENDVETLNAEIKNLKSELNFSKIFIENMLNERDMILNDYSLFWNSTCGVLFINYAAMLNAPPSSMIVIWFICTAYLIAVSNIEAATGRSYDGVSTRYFRDLFDVTKNEQG